MRFDVIFDLIRAFVRGSVFAASCRPRVGPKASLACLSSVVVLSFGCAQLGPAPAWSVDPPPPAEHPIVQANDFERAVLGNGLTVMTMSDDRLPSLAMGLELRQGAASVPPEFAGVSEVAAEVMQRGAGDRDALALARVVEDAGASLSVSVGWDTTGISISGLASDQSLFFEILEDVSKRPRFEEAEFRKALSEQMAGLAAAEDDPATLVSWKAMRALYEGHRYGISMSGSRETLANLDVAKARAYWTDRFVPRNTIFWAVGALDHAEILAEVERRFGSLPDVAPGPDAPAPPARTPEARRIVVVDKADLGQARIIVAHEGIKRTEPERIPADLMNDVLGGSGFSSRLMQSVRADAGLTYGVGSGFSLRRETGPFAISTFTRVAEVRTVIDLLLLEMRAIQGDRPVSAEELQKFISYNVGRFGLSLETPRAVLGSLIDLEVHGLPQDSLDTYRRRVRAVTLEDVKRAAQTRLHPERAAIVVLGPASEIVPLLEDLGPVEVWQP